jgi:signal peptidase I
MAGGLLPPVGVFLGQRWGYVLGQYVVWGTLVALLLRVLHTGFTPVFLAPAVLLGVLLVSLSPPRTSGEAKRAEKKPESFGVWLKENIEAIVIAFIMALVIRCFCIEVFKIPSSSMEPTLLGDVSESHSRNLCPFENYHVSPGGDRIMVTKYFYSFSPIERYDVLVFKFPLNHAKNFIKRVVGLPNEYLKIHRGNLYVAKEEKGPYQIARRTMRTQDSIWIEPQETNNFLGAKGENFWKSWEQEVATGRKAQAKAEIENNELSTREVSGERSLSFAYKAQDLNDGNGTAVDDQRIVFEVELTSPKGQVFAEIVNSYGRFETVLDTDGTSWLHHYPPDKPGTVTSQPTGKADLKDVQLTMDRRVKLELSIFDGVAYVRVNDGERARITFIDNLEELREDATISRRIAFGSRGATIRVRNLGLGRDIFYKGKGDRGEGAIRDDEPVKIPPGHYVMMGDNVTNSHDSRAWSERTFKLKDGRTVVCEAQQVNYGPIRETLKKKLNLPALPDFGIDGDIDGNEVAFNQEDIESDTKRPYHFVDEKFIVGKALWIWWPQGRWFHLIR